MKNKGFELVEALDAAAKNLYEVRHGRAIAEKDHLEAKEELQRYLAKLYKRCLHAERTVRELEKELEFKDSVLRAVG